MQTETLLPDRLRDMKAATMNVTPESKRCDILLGDYQTMQVLEIGEWWTPFKSEPDGVFLVEADREEVNKATFLLAQGKKNTTEAKRLVTEAPTNAAGRSARIQFNSEHRHLKDLKRMAGAIDCQVGLVGHTLDGRAIIHIKRSS